MTESGQNRHEDRLVVRIPAKCINKIDRRPATIGDLSRKGCRIGNHARRLLVGTRVMIKCDGLEPLSAVVKWSNQDFAGLEFEAPLNQFVFERLSRMHATP